jgi:hypothetical protein
VTWVLIVITAVVVIGLVAWFVAARQVPEQAASHAGEPSQPNVRSRPAGPGAENMDPDPPGGDAPPGNPPGTAP